MKFFSMPNKYYEDVLLIRRNGAADQRKMS